MYKQIALKVYKRFSEKEGNQHITSEGALGYVLKYLRYNNAQTVLELGTGIGTVAYAIFQGIEKGYLKRGLTYYGTEANDFCVMQIKKNVKFSERFSYFQTLSDVPSITFDFIIIDGRDSASVDIVRRLNKHGIIFIEGKRTSQLQQLLAHTERRKKVIFREISLARRPYGPFRDKEVGGGAIVMFEPTLFDYVNFTVRKAVTSFKYRILLWIKRKVLSFSRVLL